MFGSAAGHGRRSLWALLSFLFVLGVAVSTIMVHSERNGALDSAVKRARDEAQLVTSTLTGKQLTKPVTGSSYDRLAAKIWRSASSKGSIVGVTVWSSGGRILFSLNESLVGTTPPGMRSLITGIAKGSGSARVLDDTVQTFTPVSKATDGPVAIVEVDQPLAVVEAQIGDLWSMLRLGSAFGLTVSLLLLGLTFVSSKSLVRAPEEDDERPMHHERQQGDEGAELNAEGQPKEPPTESPAPTLEEDLEALQADLDQAVDQDEALEGDLESQESVWREEFQDTALEGDLESQESMRQWDEELQDTALEGDLESQESVWREEFQEETLDGELDSQDSVRQWDEELQDTALEGDFETQESMRQWREEFKARAEQAELRLKKMEGELHEAPSAPDSER